MQRHWREAHFVKKKKAFYALGAMIFLGASLLLVIVAADEQSGHLGRVGHSRENPASRLNHERRAEVSSHAS